MSEKRNLRERNVKTLTEELSATKWGVCQCCGYERRVLVSVGTWKTVCWVCLKQVQEILETRESVNGENT